MQSVWRSVAVASVVAFLTSGATAGALGTDEAADAGPVKLVLLHGHVRSGDEVAEALAINGRGVIVAVGSDAEIERLRGEGTRVLDLAGGTVLPGFSDMHVHPVFAGLQALRCIIPQGSRLAAIQKIVRDCAAKAGPGKWITGGQWDAPAIGRTPTRQMLDVVSPDNPVLLGDSSEHSGWANSRALAIAGVTRNTPDPKNGIIERNASGEPTGALREEAVALVKKHVPPPDDATVRAALQSSVDTMLSFGITSFTEAAAGYSSSLRKEVNAFVALADAGTLKQRVRLCLSFDPDNPEFESVLQARNLYVRERLQLDCVKIFLDGVPTESHTAAMLEPYASRIHGRDDEASRKGMLLLSQEAIDRAVIRFDRMGMAVKFHAAGDAAVRAGLNGIEAARKANGYSGILHDVGHSTFVSKEDLPRARAIGATFEVSPYLWSPSPITDEFIAAIGPERIERIWPMREMLAAGALVIPGSDWSVVPSVNPWIAVEEIVTREELGGSERSFGKNERIDLRSAIDLFTINSARHRHLESRVGRIAPGMLADVIVIDRDPFAIPAGKLHEVKVLTTIINGDVVFQR